ncbi:MAG: hypothetical protein U1E08_02825 [Coriobacteriia bacterium]|nr:hypothetical protein [Actinomycetota bacterium]MDZ4166615.1 hypothetical protein [Coriobacteriia bacterium]
MTSRVAIVEIAGRDSIAAAVAAVNQYGFRELVPTIAFTGTETGDRDAPKRAASALAQQLAGVAEVREPVALSDPALWSAMNARPAAELQRRFGVSSPCLACHLYLHLLRVPLAWSHGNAPVIAGERDTHDGRVKLSQTSDSIDAAIRVLAHAGIKLLQPVRSATGEEIVALAGENWSERIGHLGCQLSGNYVNFDGTVRYDEDGYARYLAEYFEPIGRAVIDAWRAERDGGPATDFVDVVRGVLSARRLG